MTTLTLTKNETVSMEISILRKAMEQGGYRYLRFETLSERLERARFPYHLEQGWSKKLGKNVYHFTGNWNDGSLYVRETSAAIPMVGLKAACENLIKVLEQFNY